MGEDRVRVVITGLGVVAPTGIGRAALWQAACSETAFIGLISRFDASDYRCRVGGEATVFRSDSFVDARVEKQTDRTTHMGIAACTMAINDGELDLATTDRSRLGMYFATTFGGMQFAEPELFAQTFLSPTRVSAYQSIAWFYAATQGQWSIANDVRGYGKSIVGDRAGGTQAIVLGALAIRQRHCDQVLVGGFDAPFAPYVYAIHEATGQLADTADVRAYRPYDGRACGMVLGEGAGILLLESIESARARGARIYAEFAGGAMNTDAPGEIANRSSDGLARCLNLALSDAQADTDEIDHVLPEACSIPEADERELRALNAVFGECAEPPTISVPKAAFGHTLAAAGPLDIMLGAMMLHHAKVPLAWTPAGPALDGAIRFPTNRDAAANPTAIICLTSSFHRLNAAIVLRRME